MLNLLSINRNFWPMFCVLRRKEHKQLKKKCYSSLFPSSTPGKQLSSHFQISASLVSLKGLHLLHRNSSTEVRSSAGGWCCVCRFSSAALSLFLAFCCCSFSQFPCPCAGCLCTQALRGVCGQVWVAPVLQLPRGSLVLAGLAAVGNLLPNTHTLHPQCVHAIQGVCT